MYYRNKENQKRWKKISEEITRYSPSGAYYDEKKKCYVRYYKGKHYTYYKRLSNRKIRNMMKRGHSYSKKLYDFWWNVD